MTTVVHARPKAGFMSRPATVAGASFVGAGIAFAIGGATHPTDSGEGTKVHQLHEMLVQRSWYPSHAALLASMALFAVGILALRQRPELTMGAERLLRVAFVVACVATVSMAVHLLAPLGADSLADGQDSFVFWLQTVNESVVDCGWGLAVAALAVAGGLSRVAGNRGTIVFGLVGGLAYALASATIPFTDTFDPLFKVGSLLSVWAIAVGCIELGRRTLHPATRDLRRSGG